MLAWSLCPKIRVRQFCERMIMPNESTYPRRINQEIHSGDLGRSDWSKLSLIAVGMVSCHSLARTTQKTALKCSMRGPCGFPCWCAKWETDDLLGYVLRNDTSDLSDVVDLDTSIWAGSGANSWVCGAKVKSGQLTCEHINQICYTWAVELFASEVGRWPNIFSSIMKIRNRYRCVE